jgi:hypothetical protein
VLERVDDRVGHVAGLEVLESARLLRAGAELGVDHVGHDVAEPDRRALDVQLAAHGFGQPDDRVLGGRIRRAARRAVLPGLRGDVHHVAAVAGHHARQGDLHAVDHAVDVDVDQAHRGRLVLVEEASQRHDAGVVDEHVERPEALLGGIDEGLERVALGHVELEPGGVGADLGCSLLGELGVEVPDGDLHALAREGLRRRLADAARGAGDGGDLADDDAGLLCHSETCLLAKVNDASPNASGSAPAPPAITG